MKGYSKIQLHGSKKSKSMDFSDLTHHLPQTPRKPIKTPNPLPSKEDQEGKQIKTHETHLEEDQEAKQIKTHETHLEEDQEETKQMKKTHLEAEEEDKSGQRFGVILSRNLSVSSTSSSSHRFRYEKEQKQEDNLQSAVRRAFSMRRSSSVAERYSKIHDQYVTLSSSFQEDDDGEGEDVEIDKNNNNTVMKKKKKKKKKKKTNMILKACKRIFGL